MRIVLYLVAAIIACFALFYVYRLVGGVLAVAMQALIILAVAAAAALIVRGIVRARRAKTRRVVAKPLPVETPLAKADVKAEQKAERAAEKELRTLEKTLGTETAPPSRTTAPTEEAQILKTRRGGS